MSQAYAVSPIRPFCALCGTEEGATPLLRAQARFVHKRKPGDPVIEVLHFCNALERDAWAQDVAPHHRRQLRFEGLVTTQIGSESRSPDVPPAPSGPAFPKFHSYGPYQGNYGVHCLCVEFGPVTVWFSYRTPVAFHVQGHRRVVIENYWRSTTGKHLNAIDNGAKDRRVRAATFEALWKTQVAPLFSHLPEV